MKKNIRLIIFFLICGLLTLTACDAVPREQTVTTTAAQTIIEANPETTTAAEVIFESTTEAETSATTTSATTIPPAKIKPIRSILLYTYNAYAAASAGYGYNFYYFTPDLVARGRTKNTPINTDDPMKTENMELTVSGTPDGVFEVICENMWELRFDRLPSRLDADRGIYMDHSEFYLTVTFEDGSSRTYSGYAVTSLNETYRRVVNLLDSYTKKFQHDASPSGN